MGTPGGAAPRELTFYNYQLCGRLAASKAQRSAGRVRNPIFFKFRTMFSRFRSNGKADRKRVGAVYEKIPFSHLAEPAVRCIDREISL